MARKKKVSKKAKKVTAEIVEAPEASAKPVQAEVVEKIPQSAGPDKLPALSDGLSTYLQAIQKYPLLTKEEELKIATRY
ncbi:MAG: hypothetical protein HRT44_02810 [Bdellovibrionales bacterium]|nr:hypothetical protein [Bdellovibrionales bacterium]NQZ18178.1 hypothetical protein [Bdellovibrionales bacterium]